MSYILDALKKSEQERGHGNVPDVQTVHSSSLNYRNDKKALWPYILIFAVLLNLLAIGYFILSKESPVGVPPPVTESTNSIPVNTVSPDLPAAPDSMADKSIQAQASKPSPVSTATTANQSNRAAAQEKDTAKKATPAVSQTISERPEPRTAPAEDREDIIDFHELPESIKQQIPTITISAHVYSSNPLQRSIVINNNFMEEGEYILDDLVLYEITRDGAIFNYQGTLFNYGVVSGWQ
jgi:general secretion pathway protein B